MLLETDAREVERLVLAGEHEAALARATELQRQAAKLGLAHVLILLDRLEGCARAQAATSTERGPPGTESSPPAGSAAPTYEIALTLDLMARAALDLGHDEW